MFLAIRWSRVKILEYIIILRMESARDVLAVNCYSNK